MSVSEQVDELNFYDPTLPVYKPPIYYTGVVTYSANAPPYRQRYPEPPQSRLMTPDEVKAFKRHGHETL